jgi:hypothetical protein
MPGIESQLSDTILTELPQLLLNNIKYAKILWSLSQKSFSVKLWSWKVNGTSTTSWTSVFLASFEPRRLYGILHLFHSEKCSSSAGTYNSPKENSRTFYMFSVLLASWLNETPCIHVSLKYYDDIINILLILILAWIFKKIKTSLFTML